jgi:hypothetical protein
MQLIFTVLMRQMPLYEHIYSRKVVYWLSQIGVSLPYSTPNSQLNCFSSLAPVHLSSAGSTRSVQPILRREPYLLQWAMTSHMSCKPWHPISCGRRRTSHVLQRAILGPSFFKCFWVGLQHCFLKYSSMADNHL